MNNNNISYLVSRPSPPFRERFSLFTVHNGHNALTIMAEHSRNMGMGRTLVYTLLLNFNFMLCSSLLSTRRSVANRQLASYYHDHTQTSFAYRSCSRSRSFADIASRVGASGAPESSTPDKLSKRHKILKFLGLHKLSPTHEDKKLMVSDSKLDLFEITTVKELDDYFNDTEERFYKKNGDRGNDIDYNALLRSLSVKGDTQIIGSPERKDVIHPVVQLVHERRRQVESIKATKGVEQGQTSVDGNRNVERILPPNDGCRIALAIEGGGMRGCVTAGMVTALHYLGLEDTIDVVYGSSAGTVIGAYFITRQLPWFGPEVYYDALTTAGDQFINTKRILRAVGLGLLDPRLAKDVIFRRNHGKPVLNLPYLLKTTMQEQKPLDWDTFVKMQEVQPLKIIASGLKSLQPVVMDMKRGSFNNIGEMASCMQASCLLPGVAGAVMNLRRDNTTLLESSNIFDMFARNKVKDEDYEPMADALLFQPLPFHVAVAEGATHVICLRSRPDGVDVTGKSSFFERLIVRRFFLRKNRLKEAYEYMKKHLHKKLYARDVIILNEAANDTNRKYTDTTKPHLLPIAVAPGSEEVTRLETGREAILKGVRRGFARAYDALVEDVEQRGQGATVAMTLFPDEILDYDPLEYTSTHQSAYETYKQESKGGDVT